MRKWGWLVAILALAAFLRLYALATVPTELIVDELDLYNSAKSIATTGHDLDGQVHPWFWSHWTRNPPIYGVAMYASSLVFGKNPVALRLPAVVFGLVAVALIFLIAWELSRRRDVALVAAFIAAVAPVFIQFSRTAWEPSSILPFLLGGLYCMLRGWPFAAAVLLGLTCYTYPAGWFYVFLLGAPLAASQFRRFNTARGALRYGAALVLCVLLSLPALQMAFFDPMTAGKAMRISTFHDGVNLMTLQNFARNYISHWRPSFLAFTGDPRPGLTWRYLNGFGAFYWWVLAALIVGIFVAPTMIRSRARLTWCAWWLLSYPLAGSLTQEAPNAPRTLAGMPAIALFAAFGIVGVWDAWRRFPARMRPFAQSAAIFNALVIVVWSVGGFAVEYFTQYVHRNSNAWDSGTRELFTQIDAYANGYDRVCFDVLHGTYGTDTYVIYYAVPVPAIYDVDAPDCSKPGTLIAADDAHRLNRPGFHLLSVAQDVDGNPFALLYAKPRR